MRLRNQFKYLLPAVLLLSSVTARPSSSVSLSCSSVFDEIELNIQSLTGAIESLILKIDRTAPKAVLLERNEDIASLRGHLIRKETKRIRATYYQIDGNKVGRVFFAELIEASRRGVDVELITDAMNPEDWMDSVLTPAMFKVLENNGVKVRIFNKVNPKNPLTFLNPSNLNRSHDKLLICDDLNMLTTGDHNMQNLEIAGARRGMKGLTYRGIEMGIQSKEMKDLANEYFEGMWELSESPDTHLARAEEVARLERYLPKFKQAIDSINLYDKDWAAEMVPVENIGFLHEIPGEKVHAQIAQELTKMIREAEKSVVIYAPYLRVTPRFLEALKSARSRGVQIRYVVPSWESIDTPWTMQVAQAQFKELEKMGIEIHQHVGTDFMHAKLAFIDDSKVFVGTYNFNDRSEFTDYEVGFVVSGVEIAKQAKEFDNTIMKNESQKFKPAKMTFLRSIFISLLRWILSSSQFLSNQR